MRKREKLNFDLDVFEACRLIVSFCVNYADHHTSKPAAKKMIEDTQKDSEIDILIRYSKWEELFQNKSWLMILNAAQNLNCIRPRILVSKKLIFISRTFPSQTEEYLDSKLLEMIAHSKNGRY